MDIELNQLIDRNLKIVSESKTEFLHIYDLIDKNGHHCAKYNGEIIADKMADRDLIVRLNERIDLTELGRDIANNGGWISHLDRIADTKAKQKSKTDKKEQLETEVLKLQKDSLEYHVTIREQQDRIRDLEEQTKLIELLKGYWWVGGIILLIIGWILYVL